MKKLYLLLTGFVCVNAFGQNCPEPTVDCATGNLVFNGDFEAYSQLPSSNFQIARACGWGPVANGASPDYFHVNSSSDDVQVPCNYWGHQNASSGNAYAGLGSYYLDLDDYFVELIFTELIEPLEAGQEYRLSFQIALAERNSGYAVIPEAFLSTLPVSPPFYNWWDTGITGTGIFLNDGPQITSTDWITVTYNFHSGSGGQMYLYLGRISPMIFDFLVPASSPVDGCTFPNSGHVGPYWYLDDVILTPIYNPPPMQLPKFVCEGTVLDDLTQYIGSEPDNGEFSGAGVTESGGIYSFDSSVTGPGNFQITYTYTDALGCESMEMIGSIIVLSSGDEQCGCANTLTLDTTEDGSLELYWRHEWIKADDGYSITGLKDITMRAGDYIELKPQTSYETGLQFTAEIIDCCESCRRPNEIRDNSVASNELYLSPNPARNILEIRLKGHFAQKVTVVAFDGRIVASQEISEVNLFELDVSSYADGIYVVNVTADDGSFYSQKFIKN